MFRSDLFGKAYAPDDRSLAEQKKDALGLWTDEVEITKHIDGDTFEIASGETIRLKGVDTFESDIDTLKKINPFKLSEQKSEFSRAYGVPYEDVTLEDLAAAGQVGKDMMKSLAGKKVRVSKFDKDIYNRTLANVFTMDGENISKALGAAGIDAGRNSIFSQKKKRLENALSSKRDSLGRRITPPIPTGYNAETGEPEIQQGADGKFSFGQLKGYDAESLDLLQGIEQSKFDRAKYATSSSDGLLNAIVSFTAGAGNMVDVAIIQPFIEKILHPGPVNIVEAMKAYNNKHKITNKYRKSKGVKGVDLITPEDLETFKKIQSGDPKNLSKKDKSFIGSEKDKFLLDAQKTTRKRNEAVRDLQERQNLNNKVVNRVEHEKVNLEVKRAFENHGFVAGVWEASKNIFDYGKRMPESLPMMAALSNVYTMYPAMVGMFSTQRSNNYKQFVLENKRIPNDRENAILDMGSVLAVLGEKLEASYLFSGGIESKLTKKLLEKFVSLPKPLAWLSKKVADPLKLALIKAPESLVVEGASGALTEFGTEIAIKQDPSKVDTTRVFEGMVAEAFGAFTLVGAMGAKRMVFKGKKLNPEQIKAVEELNEMRQNIADAEEYGDPFTSTGAFFGSKTTQETKEKMLEKIMALPVVTEKDINAKIKEINNLALSATVPKKESDKDKSKTAKPVTHEFQKAVKAKRKDAVAIHIRKSIKLLSESSDPGAKEQAVTDLIFAIDQFEDDASRGYIADAIKKDGAEIVKSIDSFVEKSEELQKEGNALYSTGAKQSIGQDTIQDIGNSETLPTDLSGAAKDIIELVSTSGIGKSMDKVHKQLMDGVDGLPGFQTFMDAAKKGKLTGKTAKNMEKLVNHMILKRQRFEEGAKLAAKKKKSVYLKHSMDGVEAGVITALPKGTEVDKNNQPIGYFVIHRNGSPNLYKVIKAESEFGEKYQTLASRIQGNFAAHESSTQSIEKAKELRLRVGKNINIKGDINGETNKKQQERQTEKKKEKRGKDPSESSNEGNTETGIIAPEWGTNQEESVEEPPIPEEGLVEESEQEETRQSKIQKFIKETSGLFESAKKKLKTTTSTGIEYLPKIIARDGKTEIIGKFDKGKVLISLDFDLWQKYMDETRWTNSRHLDTHLDAAKPLPEDIFKTKEDLLSFLIYHELGHSLHPQKEEESKGDYETRINNFAIKELGLDAGKTEETTPVDWFKAATGKFIEFTYRTGVTISDFLVRKGLQKNSLLNKLGGQTLTEKLISKTAAQMAKDKGVNPKYAKALGSMFAKMQKAGKKVVLKEQTTWFKPGINAMTVDGELPAEIYYAMASAMLNWIHSDAAGAIHNNKHEIAMRLYNGNYEKNLTREEFRIGSTMGLSIPIETGSVGKQITKLLGLEFKKLTEEERLENGDITSQSKLDASFGLMAFDILSRAGLITIDNVDLVHKGDRGWVYRTNEKVKDVTTFRQIKVKSSDFKLIGEIAAIKKAMNKSEKFFKAVDDTEVSRSGFLEEVSGAIQKKVPGSMSLLSKPHRSALTVLQAVAWKPLQSNINLLNKFTPEGLNILFNIKDPGEFQVGGREAIQSRNDGIARSLKSLKELEDSGLSRFFFKYKFINQYRLLIDSNNVNPLADKEVARFMVSPEKLSTEFNPAKEENIFGLFKLSIVQALGGGFDKGNYQEASTDFDRIFAEYEDIAREYIKTGNINSILSDNDAMVRGIGGHGLAGIVALAEYINWTDGKQDTIKTSLGVEVDGITNGYAIGLMQFVGSKGSSMDSVLENLERVGVSKTKGGYEKVINSNFLDAYRHVAANLVEQIELAKEGENLFHKFTSLDILNGKSLTDDASFARKFVKYPFMIINYVGGIKTVSEGVAHEVVGRTYEQITDAVNNKDREGLNVIISALGQFNSWYNNKKNRAKILNAFDNGTLLEMDLPMIAVESNIAKTYKSVLNDAFKELTEPTKEIKDTLMQAMGMVAFAFKEKYEREVANTEADLVKRHPTRGKLNDSEKLHIAKSLISSHFPKLRGAWSGLTSEGKHSFIDMISKPKTSPGKDHIVSNRIRKENGKSGSSQTTIMPFSYDEPGAKFLVRMIQNIDASIAIQNLLSNKNSLNIHDAVLSGLRDIEKATNGFNDKFFNINKKYSIAKDVKELFDSVFANVIDEGSLGAVNKLYRNSWENNNRKKDTPFMTYSEKKSQLDAIVEQNDKERTELFEHITRDGVQTYYLPLNRSETKTEKTELHKDVTPVNNRNVWFKIKGFDNKWRALPGETNIYVSNKGEVAEFVNNGWESFQTIYKNEKNVLRDHRDGNILYAFGETQEDLESDLALREWVGTATEADLERVNSDVKKLDAQTGTKSDRAHSTVLDTLMDSLIKPLLERVGGLSIEVNKTNFLANGLIKKREKILRLNYSDNAPETYSEQTRQEVYLHELVHAVGHQLVTHNQRFREKLQKMSKLVERDLHKKYNGEGWRAFLDARHKELLDPKEEIKRAKQQYSAAFNDGEMQEFLAYALSNKALSKQLMGMNPLKPNAFAGGTWYEKLFNLFQEGIELVQRKISGKKVSANMYAQLLDLTQDVATINKSRILDTARVLGSATDMTALDNWIKDNASDIIRSNAERVSKFLADIGSDFYDKVPDKLAPVYDLFYTPTLVLAATFASGQTWNQKVARVHELASIPGKVRAQLENRLLNWMYKEWLGFTGKSPMYISRGVTMSNHLIDQARKQEKERVERMLIDAFDKIPSAEENKALTQVLARTHAFALMNTESNFQEILDLITNESKLDAAITKELKSLKISPTDYWYKQIYGMAEVRIFGETDYPMIFSNMDAAKVNAEEGSVNVDVTRLRKLAAMVAIRKTTNEVRNLVAGVGLREMAREGKENWNGFTATLTLLASAQKASAEGTFAGQEMLMSDGYVSQITNPHKDILADSINQDTIDHMHLRGYELQYDLPQQMNETEPVGLYVAKNLPLETRTKGMLSFTAKKHSGTSVKDVYARKFAIRIERAELIPDPIDREAELKKLYKERANFKKAAFAELLEEQRGMKHIKSGKKAPLPVVNARGEVVDFTYEMSTALKDKYLDLDSNIFSVVAENFGRVTDRNNTEKVNKEGVDSLAQRYEEHGPGNKHEFVDLLSAKIKEQVFIHLPYEARKHIEKLAKDTDGRFMVEESYMDAIFGYKNWSISDLLPANGSEKTKRNIRYFEEVVNGIASIVNNNIVIKTPAVWGANFISNYMTSVISGINPIQTIKYWREGLTELKLIQADMEVLAQFDHRARVDVAWGKKNANRRHRLVGRINSNPTKELVDAGLYNAITTQEMQTDEFSYKNQFISNLEKKVENFKGIGTLTKIVKGAYLAEDTSTYKSLLGFVQVSDFLGRYGVWKQMTEVEGKTKDEAYQYIQDVFVDFNPPLSKYTAWANSMGMILFYKYFQRIQRPIFGMIKHHPTKSMAILGMKALTGMAPSTIFNSSIPLAGNLAPTLGWLTPWEMFKQFAIPSGIEIGYGSIDSVGAAVGAAAVGAATVEGFREEKEHDSPWFHFNSGP